MPCLSFLHTPPSIRKRGVLLSQQSIPDMSWLLTVRSAVVVLTLVFPQLYKALGQHLGTDVCLEMEQKQEAVGQKQGPAPREGGRCAEGHGRLWALGEGGSLAHRKERLPLWAGHRRLSCWACPGFRDSAGGVLDSVHTTSLLVAVLRPRTRSTAPQTCLLSCFPGTENS